MFTLSDIREIAVQIERNGEAVYRQTAKKVKDARISRLLENLAEQETEHARWFERLDERQSFKPQDRRIHDLGRELLQNMMAQQTFSLDTEQISNATEMRQVLDQSIEFEKDTILFYEMLHGFLDHSETMQRLEHIIDEEHSHIERLNDVARNLNSAK